MTERQTIGAILKGVGRISEEDVTTALAHQREHGGYFGEALLACGLISEGELEWGLASQADLPYVFPEADSIDYEAAALVPPEWALANLTLPIMKTATSLTVIVESPLATAAVEELRSRTDLDIDLALASPSKIRELIRQVYARPSAANEGELPAPVGLRTALDLALHAAAPRFGISARGRRAWAWWDEGGAIERVQIAGDWQRALDGAMEPTRGEALEDAVRGEWPATLDSGGIAVPVVVRFLADESGCEYLFQPGAQEAGVESRFPLPSDGILSEVRLLARSGKARFIVTAEPPSLGHEIVPHLPGLVLDPSWRSIYISVRDRPEEEEVFSRRLPDDPKTWASELETLRAFHFDVVSVDLSGGDAAWTASALDVAAVAFLLWPHAENTGPAYDAGIRWRLHVRQSEDGDLDWSLDPLREDAE